MRSSVRAAWPAFITLYEGRVPWLYLDTVKLVTFGLGNMVDAGSSITDFGITRPWRTLAGELVNEAAIRADFARVQARTDLADNGGFAFESVARLRLRDADIDEAMWVTADRYWVTLAGQLPDLEEWPADAQLALLNMAWNLGPNFLGAGWPNFTAGAKAGDFVKCANECMRSVKAKRDYRNRSLFYHAAAVDIFGSPNELHGV
jgi:GH24 family phage-related lysozyme (muramidase)